MSSDAAWPAAVDRDSLRGYLRSSCLEGVNEVGRRDVAQYVDYAFERFMVRPGWLYRSYPAGLVNAEDAVPAFVGQAAMAPSQPASSSLQLSEQLAMARNELRIALQDAGRHRQVTGTRMVSAAIRVQRLLARVRRRIAPR